MLNLKIIVPTLLILIIIGNLVPSIFEYKKKYDHAMQYVENIKTQYDAELLQLKETNKIMQIELQKTRDKLETAIKDKERTEALLKVMRN